MYPSIPNGKESLPPVDGIFLGVSVSIKKSFDYLSIVLTSKIIFDSAINAFIES